MNTSRELIIKYSYDEDKYNNIPVSNTIKIKFCLSLFIICLNEKKTANMTISISLIQFSKFVTFNRFCRILNTKDLKNDKRVIV